MMCFKFNEHFENAETTVSNLLESLKKFLTQPSFKAYYAECIELHYPPNNQTENRKQLAIMICGQAGDQFQHELE